MLNVAEIFDGKHRIARSTTLARTPGAPGTLLVRRRLPAHCESAHQAVVGVSPAQAFAALGVEAELEAHGATLHDSQAVAEPVVPPVGGGPDAERGRPHEAAAHRQPVAHVRRDGFVKCLRRRDRYAEQHSQQRQGDNAAFARQARLISAKVERMSAGGLERQEVQTKYSHSEIQ